MLYPLIFAAFAVVVVLTVGLASANLLSEWER